MNACPGHFPLSCGLLSPCSQASQKATARLWLVGFHPWKNWLSTLLAAGWPICFPAVQESHLVDTLKMPHSPQIHKAVKCEVADL